MNDDTNQASNPSDVTPQITLKPAQELSAEEARSRFINRELSWIDFNYRVLENARDRKTPLAERLNFLSITQSNQDEFISVRMGSLRRQQAAGLNGRDYTGYTVDEQIEAIGEKMHEIVKQEYHCYNRQIIPALKRYGIRILEAEELDEQQLTYAERYFDRRLYPILTPMAVDQGRPFPLIMSETLNIAVLLKLGKGNEGFATVQVPSNTPRLIELPLGEGRDAELGRDELYDPQQTKPCHADFILVEDLIRYFLDRLFPGQTIQASGDYRIIRNADFDLDEEDAPDLLLEIEERVRLREWGEVLQLSYRRGLDERLLTFLRDAMKVRKGDLYRVSAPLNLRFLGELRSHRCTKALPELRYPKFSPQQPEMLPDPDEDLFHAISERDILLSHPYESFDPVLKLIEQAAHDPKVLAIKQTLYRVSGDSPIIANLAEAARNGKQVMVLLELKARFDEGNNIHWARELEKAGCHVIYGLVGLKTHSKITLIVRREDEGIRRYVHLGTGNYNDTTAKLYTDLGFLTSSEAFGEDASNFFNMISGFAEPSHWNKLVCAPINLRERFIALINREIEAARAGYDARIVAKMNSLCDEEIIQKLYEASQAGVEIELIVRGINGLRSGIPGLSENIKVRSLIGRYLEHSRIYAFYNRGRQEVYLSSADWMPRNLNRRIELLFPIEDPHCLERVLELLDIHLRDTERVFVQTPAGDYERLDLRGVTERVDSMVEQEKWAVERAEAARELQKSRRFQPKVSEAPGNRGEAAPAEKAIAEEAIPEDEDDFREWSVRGFWS